MSRRDGSNARWTLAVRGGVGSAHSFCLPRPPRPAVPTSPYYDGQTAARNRDRRIRKIGALRRRGPPRGALPGRPQRRPDPAAAKHAVGQAGALPPGGPRGLWADLRGLQRGRHRHRQGRQEGGLHRSPGRHPGAGQAHAVKDLPQQHPLRIQRVRGRPQARHPLRRLGLLRDRPRHPLPRPPAVPAPRRGVRWAPRELVRLEQAPRREDGGAVCALAGQGRGADRRAPVLERDGSRGGGLRGVRGVAGDAGDAVVELLGIHRRPRRRPGRRQGRPRLPTRLGPPRRRARLRDRKRRHGHAHAQQGVAGAAAGDREEGGHGGEQDAAGDREGEEAARVGAAPFLAAVVEGGDGLEDVDGPLEVLQIEQSSSLPFWQRDHRRTRKRTPE